MQGLFFLSKASLRSRSALRTDCGRALLCALAVVSCFDPPKEKSRAGYKSEDPSWREPPAEIPIQGGQGSGSPDDSGWQTLAEPPQASDRYVFEVSPVSGTVAIIDARTLRIQTLRTGDSPSHLTTVPGGDEALVINVGSEDASLITFVDGSATALNFEVVRGANSIATAPDGQHAVVFFDADELSQGEEFGDFEAVTVVALPGGQVDAYDVSVGFKPTDVTFTNDGTRAFVRTDEGISVLDFATIDASQGGVAPSLPFADLGGVVNFEFSADGERAISWVPGGTSLRLLDLVTGEAKTLELYPLFLVDADGNPDTPPIANPYPIVSDVAVAADGSLALAAVTGPDVVLQLPLPDAFTDASSIGKRPISHGLDHVDILPQTSLALAYIQTRGVEQLSVVDLTSTPDTPATVVALRKGISAIVPSADGATALIVHSKWPGQPDEDGISIEERIDRSFGYSLLRPQTGDVRLQLTDAPVKNAMFVADSSHLFFTQTISATRVYEVHRVKLDNFALQPVVRLDSAPSALGIVASQGSVFVTTAHPDGRLTFIEWATGDVRTVTGFEINSQIRD